MAADSRRSWYRIIEPGIRKQVRLLRDNGFNTYSSCAHRMEVTLDFSPEDSVAELDRLLRANGFTDYVILTRVERRGGRRNGSGSAVVQFGSESMRNRIARRYRSLVSWWWEAAADKG
jgi:hypothetical protein